MLGNYTFTRYKDLYYIGNSDPTALFYSLAIQVNCAGYSGLSSGTIPANASSFQLIVPNDGDYQLTLSRGGQSTVISIRNYFSLQRSLISNLRSVICGINNCRDCEKQGLDDCVSYQAVFGQIIGYQYLIKPYSPDYCTNGDLVDMFIHQALELNKCTLYTELYNQLVNEAIYAKITTGKRVVSYLAVVYYLVFYFYERLLAVDNSEQAYIDSKYYWTQAQFCITKAGINISQLSSLFTTLAGDNSQPPSVGNVTKMITYTSGLQIYTFSEADFTNNFADPGGKQPNTVLILNNAFNGLLYFNGLLINGENFSFNIADANRLTYQYTPTMTNHIYERLFFQISDTNSTPKYSNMATFTIDVNAYVNQPPSSVGDNSITIGNRVDRVFTLADFSTNTTPAYADPENDGVYEVRIDSLPTLGTLLLSGTPVTSGQIIPASSIVSGLLIYDAPNQDAAAAVSFDFSIADTGSHTFVS